MTSGAFWAEANILIVDDVESNVRLLRRVLSRAGYINVQGASSGKEALEIITAESLDLILLDVNMPVMGGREVLSKLRLLLPEHTYLPVLVLTADTNPDTKRELLSAGAMDFVAKPFDVDEVRLRVSNLLQTRSLHLHMEGRVAERTESIQIAHEEILARLVLAGEFRDDETGQHAKRVGDSAAQIAHLLGFSPEKVDLIRRAAPLHDLGKIAVPDTILLKPDKLTDAEWCIMRQHTTHGSTILENSRVELIQLAHEIALYHHEKLDGSGYPHGLRGTAIPMVARIVAVADVYDALTHSRPYRAAWSSEEALLEIERGCGTHFDPQVVAAFFELMAWSPRTAPFEAAPIEYVDGALAG